VGIGAGYYEDDHRWLGIGYLDAAGRVQRLSEVADVLDRALRGERVTYSGAHARLDDAPSLQPFQLPRPPIWIAVHGRNHSVSRPGWLMVPRRSATKGPPSRKRCPASVNG
jgi:alkanesulfonate monooxygenase SsuD/methylene tetrahydromethanopterin reductase-like flavin-dependent oxidoreductase (luciferase family)